MNDHIDSTFLENNGWERKGSTYTRLNRTVKYDGTYWYYEGKQIEDSILKNPQLKVPSVNPNLPPPGFKSIEDYYSRLMENS